MKAKEMFEKLGYKKIEKPREMITHEKATDKNIITKQVVINTPTSARLLPITADEKVIDEIQQALNELERLKKQEKLLSLYRKLDDCIVAPNGHHVCRYTDDEKYLRIRKQIKELENDK